MDGAEAEERWIAGTSPAMTLLWWVMGVELGMWQMWQIRQIRPVHSDFAKVPSSLIPRLHLIFGLVPEIHGAAGRKLNG
ncbi:MAG: hypothetical protein ACJAXQ_000301 [Parvibaculaceae bacterium]|jgi:hypothetical protein